jgi:WD40 repeat protein
MHYKKDAGDWSIRYWSLTKRKCLRILMGHDFWVSALGFCAEDVAVSAGWDGTLRLWDLHSGDCTKVLRGHEQFVTSLAVSQDGHTALSGSADCTARAWDLHKGEALRTLGRHAFFVCDVALDETHGRAFSSSLEGTIKVWDLETGLCIDEKHLGRDFLERVPVAFVDSGPARMLIAAQGDVLKRWDGLKGVEQRIWPSADV